jgi:hypothetical protein
MNTKKRRSRSAAAETELPVRAVATVGQVADARYPVGSKVVSLVTAQGLEAGRTYTVEAVSWRRTFVGGFTVVTVTDGTLTVEVRNPHLVLR